MFLIKRGSNNPRLVVDYRRLNDAIRRPHWNLLSSDQVRKFLTGRGGYLISCDLKQGYHFIFLPEESRDLTTFSCELGRFHWKCYPQGISSSGDVFNLHVDIAMSEVPSVWLSKCMDDLLIHGKHKKECFQRLEFILNVLKEKGMVCSLSKIQEGMKIDYCEYIISVTIEDGPVTISPARSKVTVLLDLP